MENVIEDEAKEMFLAGDHVCRHTEGVFNSVFSDQFGEQTYIRYGKAKGGLVGLTLSQDQVACWVLAYHICNQMSLLMDQMFSSVEGKESKHKEEGEGRRKLDAKDREKLRTQVQAFGNPLESSANVIVNIANGCMADEKVNVADAVSIGQGMAAKFLTSLPGGFHDPVQSKVVTMNVMKKTVKIGDQTIYSMEKLYSHLLIISNKRSLPLQYVFGFELAPLPSSLFDEYGWMRKT